MHEIVLNPSSRLFVTGIGTNIGKTIVSAALVEHYKADYWKPVQAGDLNHTDSHKIAELISNPISVIHPERHLLTLAASPHKAAKQDGLTISPNDFLIPETDNHLIIEGAGGLFVPLSDKFLIIDLIRQTKAEVVLVVRNYLGCINHTLLSIHALTQGKLPLKLVVFNGIFDQDTMDVIIGHLPENTAWKTMTEFQALDKKNTITAFK